MSCTANYRTSTITGINLIFVGCPLDRIPAAEQKHFDRTAHQNGPVWSLPGGPFWPVSALGSVATLQSFEVLNKLYFDTLFPCVVKRARSSDGVAAAVACVSRLVMSGGTNLMLIQFPSTLTA